MERNMSRRSSGRWRTSKNHVVYSFFIFFFTVLAFFSSISSSTKSYLDFRRPFSSRNFNSQDGGGKVSRTWSHEIQARRYLRGIGSSPPRCTSKCGRCTPCKPVHVPVPPGTPVTAEYYPEAWRCKCGNRLYMP